MNVYTQAIYRKNKTALFITVLCHILLSMSGIVCSIFLGEVINAITAADMGKLRGLAIFALAFIIGEAMVQTVTCFTLPRFVHQGLRGYKEEVFRRISEKGIGAFYQERTSRYVSALSNDVKTSPLYSRLQPP